MISEKPVLRWVGGKTQLLTTVMKNVPTEIETYYEPFVGGGAVMLGVLRERNAKRIVVSDVNEELINFYRCVQQSPTPVHSLFSTFRNDSDTYYKIRSWDRDSETYSSMDPVQKAARFLYLNRSSFQGMWRVSVKAGFHNVPFGRRKSIDVSIADLKLFSQSVKNVEFKHCDFAELLVDAKPGDFVYLDPPYHPTSPTSGYTEYAKGDFGYGEQIRLRNECQRLSDLRVGFLLSQSDCDEVHKLYENFDIQSVPVVRKVAAKSASRGKTTELLIVPADPLCRSFAVQT